MSRLRDRANIGEKLEQQLFKAGIETLQELCEAGSREAWLRILAFDRSACINRLLGLEGAVRNIPKKDLPQEVKKDLHDFYEAHKKWGR